MLPAGWFGNGPYGDSFSVAEVRGVELRQYLGSSSGEIWGFGSIACLVHCVENTVDLTSECV